MEYKEFSLEKASDLIINKKLKNLKAQGGVVGLDKFGNVTMTFNTKGMFRGFRVSGKDAVVKLYDK